MRIGGNPAGLDSTARNSLNRAFAMFDRSSLRLSTMQRINRGSDDPTGLMTVGHMRSELNVIEAAGRNVSCATGMISVADSALSRVGNVINTIRGNAVETARQTLDQQQQSTWESTSRIADADVAIEASQMVQSQILIRSAIASLLLEGQRRELIGGLLA